jgi:hypothetical protein
MPWLAVSATFRTTITLNTGRQRGSPCADIQEESDILGLIMLRELCEASAFLMIFMSVAGMLLMLH